MIVEFENVKAEQIVNDPRLYVSAFKQHGIIVFKKAYFSDDEVLSIFDSFSHELNFTARASSDDGSLDDVLSWTYIQKHDEVAQEMDSSGTNSATSDIIQWHVEGVSMKWQQRAAGWNMEHLTCERGSGQTGFVDMCQLFDDLSDDHQKFLDKTTIIHMPNWQCAPQNSESFRKAFTSAVSSGYRKIQVEDGEGYLYSYSRPAVQLHPSNGRSTLRTCPCFAEWGLQDYMLFYDGRFPTSDELTLFNQIMEIVSSEISRNTKRQMWHTWDEGDLVIPDLFRMAHGVRGGFSAGQRRFRGNWCFETGTPKDPMERSKVEKDMTDFKGGTHHASISDGNSSPKEIMIIEGAFDPSLIYEKLKNAEWVNMKPGSPPESTHYHLVEELTYSQFLNDLLGSKLEEIKKAADEFFGFKHSVIDSRYSFAHIKYGEGAGMGSHVDVSSSKTETSDFSTALFYINDDYSGGELVVDGSERVVMFKPKSGDVVLLDGNVRHESRASQNGEKIVAVVHWHRK